MREIICALYEMISNVRDKQNLSNNELKSLKNIVYRRLGLGVRYGGVLTRLPSVMFYLLFFGLSPLLIPKVRIALSGFYNKLHEFRYKVNLFRH